MDFIDSSRAFDSVKNFILINKLHSLGIIKTALQWFESHITSRSQCVEISHLSMEKRAFKISSDLKLTKFGVPQGSILGLLLFLRYLKI